MKHISISTFRSVRDASVNIAVIYFASVFVSQNVIRLENIALTIQQIMLAMVYFILSVYIDSYLVWTKYHFRHSRFNLLSVEHYYSSCFFSCTSPFGKTISRRDEINRDPESSSGWRFPLSSLKFPISNLYP